MNENVNLSSTQAVIFQTQVTNETVTVYKNGLKVMLKFSAERNKEVEKQVHKIMTQQIIKNMGV